MPKEADGKGIMKKHETFLNGAGEALRKKRGNLRGLLWEKGGNDEERGHGDDNGKKGASGKDLEWNGEANVEDEGSQVEYRFPSKGWPKVFKYSKGFQMKVSR